MSRPWLVLFMVVPLVGCEAAVPAPTSPITPVVPSTTASPLGAGRPTSEIALPTALPIATLCPRPTPTLVPALAHQHGNLDLNVPYHLGFVRFNLVPCRDIETIRQRYGLGATTRVITEPSDPTSDPDDVRGRYFRARVPVGEEPSFVTRLAEHPEDFQYVEFAFAPVVCVRSCTVASAVEPKEAAAGASFRMRICCFDEGTRVAKTFTLPSGRTIVIPDTAGSDRTVPAGWGGSPDDERGLYTVTVTGGEIGSMVRFRVR